MKIMPILSMILIVIIVVASAFLIAGFYHGKGTNTTINTTPTNNPATPTFSPTTIDDNKTLGIPPNDYAINHISWSSYPNLQTGYVHLAEVQGPNEYIDHQFIVVQILTEVKGTDNTTVITEQLTGVAHEARAIYGPNSGIHIISTKGGVAGLSISMLPYDDNPY